MATDAATCSSAAVLGSRADVPARPSSSLVWSGLVSTKPSSIIASLRKISWNLTVWPICSLPGLEVPAMTGRLDALDDPDYPAYTTGRAAEVLAVQQAFLRSLDTVGAVTPQRTAGGRRRYSRRQLAFAARIRELVDQGHTLAAAQRILALEDDLTAERALTARLHQRLAGQDLPES